MRDRRIIDKDDSITSLYGGQRISKSNALISLIGEVDELNSLLGILISELERSELGNLSDNVRQIQRFLFVLGADLSTPINASAHLNIVRINQKSIDYVVNVAESCDKELPQLHNFVLPSGHKCALLAYQARAVTRRVERSMVKVIEENINTVEKNRYKLAHKFLNELSDALFKLFRFVNHKLDQKETVWEM